MNIKKNILFPVFLFLITVIYYFPIINLPIGPYDEAVILVGAERVLHGEIPYKDFFSVYPPGQVYTLAVLFKLFGTSVIIERAYDIVIKSLLSLLIFILIRLLSSTGIALTGWLMSLVWVKFSSFPAYPVYPAILFIYFAIFFILLHMKRDKVYYVLLSALSIVFAFLFRHDMGGPAAAIIALILFSRKILQTETSWRPLVTYITSGIIAGVPILIFFYLNIDMKVMINDLILWPMNVFPEYQNFPYPVLSRWNLPFFVFPLVLLTGVILSYLPARKNMESTLTYGILLISFIGIAFFNQVRVRSDSIHLLPVAMTAVLLAPILLSALAKGLSLGGWKKGLLYLLFTGVFGLTLSMPIGKVVPSISAGYVLESVNPDIIRAEHVIINQDLKKTVKYIRSNTSKDEYIFVGVRNHDRLIFNRAIVYFLTERNSATKYHEYNPGLINTLAVQGEIVNALQDKSVRVAVLTPGWRYEPNLSRIDTKIDILDDYISTNFELEETYGIYEIWERKLSSSVSQIDGLKN